MSDAIVVFARAPELGRVKTRLSPGLGEKRTLDLYRAFLSDTLEHARSTGARVVLAHTPTREPFAEQAAADECVIQPEASFGERFDHALRSTNAERVVLVGADAPHVGPDVLLAALGMLRDRSAVLGPGTEGGFYLLGCRTPPPSVAAAFDEPNEAAAVCRALRPALLPPSFDVDVSRDLANLILHLETLQAAGAPVPRRTSGTIRALGLRVAPAASGSRGREIVVG